MASAVSRKPRPARARRFWLSSHARGSGSDAPDSSSIEPDPPELGVPAHLAVKLSHRAYVLQFELGRPLGTNVNERLRAAEAANVKRA
jgi:hypothetical protein